MFHYFAPSALLMTISLLPRALQMNLENDPKFEICIFNVDVTKINVLVISNLVQCFFNIFKCFEWVWGYNSTGRLRWILICNKIFSNST